MEITIEYFTMTKLQELYETREKLQSLGIVPNVDLEKQLATLEEEFIKNEIVPQIEETVEPVLKQVKRELVFVLEYYPEEGLHVQLSRKRSVVDELPQKIGKMKPCTYVKETNTHKSELEARGQRIKEDIFLQDKKLDWSLLTNGVTLVNQCYDIILKQLDWDIKVGEIKDVKIYIGKECFDARFHFQNYDNRLNDIMQIRYSPGLPIATKLQHIFNDIYQKLERERLNKERGLKTEKNEIDRYIHIYATTTPYVFRFVVV